MNARASTGLRAAAGEVEITPPAGNPNRDFWLSGFAGALPATGVHDPLMARALLLHDGATPLLIVACDLIGLDADTVAGLRARIAAAGGIPRANTVIACTHTHSGPAAAHLRGTLGRVDEPWLADVLQRIEMLVAGLPGALRPARLAHGAAQVTGIGFNRQDTSWPIDETLGVLAVEDEGGVAIATLLHYATHAVILGPANRQVSADFPGAAAREIARRRGGVGLYLQGACGDVDPRVNLDRGWGTGTFADCEAVGARLAEAAQAALVGAERTDQAHLAANVAQAAVPLCPPPAPSELDALVAGWTSERANAADHTSLANADAMLAWAAELRGTQSEGWLARELPAEVWRAEIGDLRLVGLPFEVYGGIGARIRQTLAPRPAWVIGYANGIYGYCATRQAFAQGGYGPATSHRWFPALLTPIAAGVEDALVSAVLA